MKRKVSIDKVLSIESGNDDNEFLDDMQLSRIFGVKMIDEVDDPNPELDKKAFVLGQHVIDTKNIKCTLEPFAEWVCDLCAYNYAKAHNIDTNSATPEQLEQAKHIFARQIKIHKQQEHKGLQIPQVLTKRQLLQAQKSGDDMRLNII